MNKRFTPVLMFTFCGICLLLSMAGTIWASASTTPLRPLERYGIDFWDEASGLPQSRIRAVVQTRDGYLWLGTDNGLVRFDGIAFTTFGTQTGSLGDNEVSALAEDALGGLWIGTYGGGLSHYMDGRFAIYKVKDGLPDDMIDRLDADPEGNIWMITPSGVCRWSQGKCTRFTKQDGLPEGEMTALCAGAREGVFVANGNRLLRFSGGRFSTVADFILGGEGKLDHLACGADGSLLASFEKGVIKRLAGGKPTSLELEGGISLRGAIIYEDPRGTLWVGGREGLFRVNGRTLEALPDRNARDRMGTVYSLCQDQEGSLWVGLEVNGLSRLRATRVSTLGTAAGLPDERTRAVFRDGKGKIWIGTTRGLVQYDGTSMIPIPAPGESLPLNITALAEDKDGMLWAGAGLNLFTLQDGKLIRHPAWNRAGDIRVLYRDPAGRMWAGTDGKGLIQVSKDGIHAFTTRDGLAGDQVRDIFCDRRGVLWVATFGGGVGRCEGGRFTSLTTRDGLGSDRVVDIHEDAEGALWFSTRGGISRLKDGKITNFTAGDGLPISFVHGITEDREGYFWCGSVTGLFRVARSEFDRYARKETSRIHAAGFGLSDGMQTRTCSAGTQPNACLTGDGRVMVCTLKGLVIADPGDLRAANRLPPPVHIESVSINRQPQPLRGAVRIPPGRGEVEIHYASPSFINSRSLPYKYRLEGFDKDWIDAGTRRFAYYASLPPGKYLFRVIACNSEGVWSKAGAGFAFVLRPYFYRTWWFYGLCALAVMLLGYAAHASRIRRHKAQERELQRRVDEALARVKVLSGMLPICANCKKVRDDKGYWNSIEQYIMEHSDTMVSHGICPECVKKLYPQVSDEVLERIKAS